MNRYRKHSKSVKLIFCSLLNCFKYCYLTIIVFVLHTVKLFQVLPMLHIGSWPSCQNKKCTCINNRFIWSKISGDNLDC